MYTCPMKVSQPGMCSSVDFIIFQRPGGKLHPGHAACFWAFYGK